MKLLFDQNLSPQLVRLLRSEYPGSEHVRNVGLATAADGDIWQYAAHEGFVIVFKDEDFEQRSLFAGHPPKVVRVKLRNCSTRQVVELFISRQNELLQFDADPVQAVLLIS